MSHNQTQSGMLMYAFERQQQIVRQLKSRGRLRVTDLAREFKTSAETIRRDLAELEGNGGLRRVHGGAVDPALLSSLELPMEERAALHIEEKRRIAQAALHLLPDNGAVFLEAASTSLVLAELMTAKRGLLVFTNGLPVAQHLATHSDLEIVMIGGRIRNRSLATLDDWLQPVLAGIHVQVAYLGTLACSVANGLTTPDTADAAMKSRCLGIADQTVLLAESAKFGVVSTCRYGEMPDLDLIITDDALGAVCAEEIRALGVELMLV